MAGGVTDFARRNEITIVRSRPGQADEIFGFEYDLAARGVGAGRGQNIRLEPEDVIVVP
jgi:hypothetical protein